MSEEANLDAYLRRINYSGSIAPTLETLQMLHRQHPAAIAFENLDPLMERPVRLQLSDIEQKLLNERRGGYCFEQNLLFEAVLEAMDYAVTPLAAGFCSVSVAALLMIFIAERGKMFQPHNPPVSGHITDLH